MLARTAHRDVELLGHLLGRRLPATTDRVEHGPASDGQLRN